MAHVESADQAIARINDASIRRDRTVLKADGDERRTAAAQFHYLRTVRNARTQVRFNPGIPNLEQAILGTTGSNEQLEKYRALAAELGKKAGQPIVEIEQTADEGERVTQALVGDVAGGIVLWGGFLQGAPRSVISPVHNVSLHVFANRLTRIAVEDGELKVAPLEQPRVLIDIADFALDETSNPTVARNASYDPDQDYRVTDGMETGQVLIGEEAIRASRLFEPGLREILEFAGTPV